MRVFKALIAVSLLGLACAPSGVARQQPQGGAPEDPAWLKEFVHKRIVYTVPGMGRVRVRKDQTYKRVGGAELKADIYSPPGSPRGARRPAVIFIHGGRVPANLRTRPKDWGAYVSFGQLVAASGFVGLTFNHRFHTWDSLGDSRADLEDLIAYVRENAGPLGVDQERITLWAVSAGSIFLTRALGDAPPYILDLANHAAGHHGFDIDDDDDRSREIIRRTLEFIRARG